MIQKHAELATRIFLTAACAFIMDVLSPATPALTAQTASFFVMVAAVLAVVSGIPGSMSILLRRPG